MWLIVIEFHISPNTQRTFCHFDLGCEDVTLLRSYDLQDNDTKDPEAGAPPRCEFRALKLTNISDQRIGTMILEQCTLHM